MRVIAGTAKGRRLTSPPGERTRPTADRVKEALFSILQPRLRDAVVLDLFAGSGALAIEALSRGARRAVLVERSRRASAAIRDNLTACDLADRAEVVTAGVMQVLGAPVAGPFDIVLLDPPYAVDQAELARVLAAVPPVLAEGGVVVLETDAHREDPPWPPGLLPREPRSYGDTRLRLADLAVEPGPPTGAPAEPSSDASPDPPQESSP